MKNHIHIHLLRSFLIISFSFIFLSSCNDRWTGEHPQITKGRTLYNKYCVECHGVNGKGNKELIKLYDNIDLTRINVRRDLVDFPILEVAKYIDGREHYKDFGGRAMPMWGVDLMTLENQYNPDTARSNLGALISYLIKIQEEE